MSLTQLGDELWVLKDQGYSVGDLPEDGEELIRWVKAQEDLGIADARFLNADVVSLPPNPP